jgi:5-formyltetrahydrofolate cyclo-ligase
LKRSRPKEEIRRKIKAKRDSLSFDEVHVKSERIRERLFRTRDFQDAKRILFYVSRGKEVATHKMIREALKLGKVIAVPIVKPDEGLLLLSEIRDFDKELEPGYLGILEPKECFTRPIELQDIDLVLVPGIAFDEFGSRLGYGGGYYDRLLRGRRKGTGLFGLAFEVQITSHIPLDSIDLRVEGIITEDRIIRVKA